MKRPPHAADAPGPLTADQIAMRESADFLHGQDPVDVEAMRWHGRRDQGLAPSEQADFERWLAADPGHQRAYSALEHGLRALRRLPPEQTARLRGRRPPAAAEPTADRRASRTRGRPTPAAVAFCCVALLAVGFGWRVWTQRPTFDQTYATERGQRLDVTLPDGSAVTLDTDTRVEVSLYGDRRQVRLPRGQAMFSVARDAARPFSVLAGEARVTVLGTRFAVRCDNCQGGAAVVDVEVESGRVAVAGAGRAGVSTELRAGQAVRVNAAGPGAIVAVGHGGIAPWRSGLLRFASTPLADAVREFERYAPVDLVIRDPAVARMAIGGSYRAADPAAFAQALPHILPVRLLRRADGRLEVVSAN
nr:FecR domain-containing protein [uncultured Duganella sp.]